jgi:6-phosphofructokinase 1
LIAEGKFGHIAALKTPDIVAVPFEVCCAKQKLVDPDGQLVKSTETIGICFGR